jgi:hypothetical protein
MNKLRSGKKDTEGTFPIDRSIIVFYKIKACEKMNKLSGGKPWLTLMYIPRK